MTFLATTSLALVVAALAAGCAADSQTAPGNEPVSTPENRTGSNISVRELRPTTSNEKAKAAAPADAARPAEPAAKTTD